MKDYKLIMFDLDGTLLPMDYEQFVNAYFGFLAKKLATHGYEPNGLIKAVWKGTMAMIANDGTNTNEQAFWNEFAGIYGESARADIVHFDAFYAQDFGKIQGVCGFNPKAAEAVRKIKAAGFTTVLATNPIFPFTATKQRTEWTGLSTDDFAYVTTYENSRFCKPNTEYYKDVMARMNVSADQCLMVGNDVNEDILAGRKAGMDVFLITECIINKDDVDLTDIPKGSFDDLTAYLQID